MTTEATRPSMTDSRTWTRIGTTEDGKPILRNPGNGQPAVLAPDRLWYSPAAYAARRRKNMCDAAPEMAEELEYLIDVISNVDNRARLLIAAERARALLRRIEGE